MENFYVDLAISILLSLLRDTKKAKQFRPALVKVHQKLGEFLNVVPPGISAMEPKASV